MSFLRQDSHKKTNTLRNIAIVVVTLAVLAFLFPYLQRAVHVPMNFFWSAREDVLIAADHLPLLFASKSQLLARIAELEEIIESQDDRSEVEMLKQDNATLRDMLGRTDQMDIVLASVLRRPGITPYDTLIISAGSKQNVQVGAAVFTAGDVAIGRTTRVFPDTSVVELFSSPGVKSVIALTDKFISAEGVGKGGGVIEVRVPHAVPVTEGDSVFLPAVYPSIFGFVERIESTPSEAFKRAYIHNPIALSELRYVYVRTGYAVVDDSLLDELQNATTSTSTPSL